MGATVWSKCTKAFSVVLPGEPDEGTDQELQLRGWHWRSLGGNNLRVLEELGQWRRSPVEGESKEVKRAVLVG